MSKHRGGVTLPDECWAWLRRTADRDRSTRDDLLEGIILNSMDEDPTERCPACREARSGQPSHIHHLLLCKEHKVPR